MLLDIIEPTGTDVPKKEEKIVGIDFGTTNSLIAIYMEKDVIVIPDENGKELIRSLLDYQDIRIESIKRIFGKSIKDIESASFVPSYLKNKISLNKESNVVINTMGNEILPIEIGAEIFKLLKKNAENFLGEKINKAVVTVPAYFDDAAKAMVKDSARLAGFEVLRLVAEPTAAAYAYSLDTGSEGNYVVYDLGGGTFDVSVLAMRMGAFQVRSIGGDSSFGGDDLDQAVGAHIAEKYSLEIKHNQEQHFLEICRYLKESVSKTNPASSFFQGKTLILNYEELARIIHPLLKHTISITKKTIYESRIDRIDGIILVGGSTKLEVLKEMIKGEFEGNKIIDNIDPDKAVVIGAAMHGRNLSSKKGDILIDIIPLSLGIELVGGVVEKIILRNTPIPASCSKRYTTYVDNQTGFDFHVVQGDREMASDCRSLLKFSLKNIPPMLAGKAVVEVNFNIDSDGLLTVNAREINTGIAQEIIVKPSYGLSPEKVFNMLEEAIIHAEEDYEYSLKAEKKVEVEAVLLRLLILLDEHKEIITIEEFDNLRKECIFLQEEIKSFNYNALCEVLKNLERKSSFFIEKIISDELANYLKGKEINKFL